MTTPTFIHLLPLTSHEMTGTKRSWEGNPVVSNNTTESDKNKDNEKSSGKMTTAMDEPSENVLSIFGTFRDELDEHHDRRERIIKASRDITALSKKIVRTLNQSLPPSISKETTPRFTQIHSLFASLAPDLTAANAWRYQRQISPGIQEYIEALSFQHYIETQELITREEVASNLPLEIMVTEEDYVMGLFDLTGEMMRFAVMGLSAGQQQPQPGSQEQGESEGDKRLLAPTQSTIVIDLRALRALFEILSIPRRHANNMFRDMGKKIEVMQNSVEKVERAAYGILVRGSERPGGWMPDLVDVV